MLCHSASHQGVAVNTCHLGEAPQLLVPLLLVILVYAKRRRRALTNHVVPLCLTSGRSREYMSSG